MYDRIAEAIYVKVWAVPVVDSELAATLEQLKDIEDQLLAIADKYEIYIPDWEERVLKQEAAT